MKKPSTILLTAMIIGFLTTGCQKKTVDTPSENVNASQTQNNQTNSVSEAVEKTNSENQEIKAERTFEYTPKVPQNGKKLGVGAVGSSELTSLVVEIDKDGNWQLLSREDNKSLVAEGEVDEAVVKKNLKDYLKNMSSAGVKPNNMHFIISSGAKKSGNTDKLIKNLKDAKYVVNTITPENEGKYAFKAGIPKEYKTNSFMVDIGSGNTKISWEENGKIQAYEAPGAKYYKKELAPKEVYDQVKVIMDKIPTDKKKYAFIIGGVPYKLAKPIRKDKQRFVVLNKPSSYGEGESEKMKAGLNIYKAMVDSTGEETQYVFDFDSHYAIGFLQSL